MLAQKFLGFNGAIDDVVLFALTAQQAEVPMHILNMDFYGFLPVPLQEHDTLEQEAEQFAHIKIENISTVSFSFSLKLKFNLNEFECIV